MQVTLQNVIILDGGEWAEIGRLCRQTGNWTHADKFSVGRQPCGIEFQGLEDGRATCSEPNPPGSKLHRSASQPRRQSGQRIQQAIIEPYHNPAGIGEKFVKAPADDALQWKSAAH